MQTGGKTTGTGTGTGTGSGKTVLIAILVPTAGTGQGGTKGGTSAPKTPTVPQTSQPRIADAMRKLAQSSPMVRNALQRNPGAVAKIGMHAQKLPVDPGRSPLSALKHGLGVSGGLRNLRRDMLKDFRKGGGEVKTTSSHTLSERGQRHADAAERGLRRGGLGLLSAAWHGTKIMREQRKTLNRERAEARAEAGTSGKPLPPDGMRALLGSAVKGVGIARDLRAGLSEMRRQQQTSMQTGMQTGMHGLAQAQGGQPRVFRATGFALGTMALRPGEGSGSDARRMQALGVALWLPQTQTTGSRDEETQT